MHFTFGHILVHIDCTTVLIGHCRYASQEAGLTNLLPGRIANLKQACDNDLCAIWWY